MITTASRGKPVWQAAVSWRNRRYITLEKAPAQAIRGTTGGETTDGDIANGELLETNHLVREYYVDVFNPDGELLRFRINRRKGRMLSFTDARECHTGTAGTTGLWGTRPAQRAGRTRCLTPSAFRIELARFIGPEWADEIVGTLLSPEFFCKKI